MKEQLILFICIALLAGFSNKAAAVESVNSTGLMKQASKFYILPIENIKNSKPNSFQLVIFKSIYTFMRIIPSLDVPDDKLMNDLFWLAPALEKWERINAEHAPKEVLGADYILYGDYEIKQKNPEKVVLKIGVWSKSENKNIFTKNYETVTDVDIFDTIDLILKNVIEDVLKIDFSLARIDFNIKSGAEKYEIFINNKLIDTADKQDYVKSISVLGGQAYKITIIRSRDGKAVYTVTKTPGAKENFSVTYFATGSVIIDPVNYGERGRIFTYTIDGKPAYANEFISNMNALSNHSITVIDQHSNLIYQRPFGVLDGLTTHVTPIEEWAGPLHIRVYSGSSAFAGLGLEYFPWRYFWIEAGSGVSWCNSQYEISPYLDIGYYLFGDMKTDFRAGLGLSAGYYQYTPADDFSQPYSYSTGAFAVAEWKWFNLKLGCSYDFKAGQAFPVAAIGIKL